MCFISSKVSCKSYPRPAILISSPPRMALWKTTKCSITFYLVHIMLSKYKPVTRISVHTHVWNFKSYHEVNGKLMRFLFFSIPHCTKGNQEMLQNCACVSVYRFVQTLYLAAVNNMYTTFSPEQITSCFSFYVYGLPLKKHSEASSAVSITTWKQSRK